jgi:hypothetical protein
MKKVYNMKKEIHYLIPAYISAFVISGKASILKVTFNSQGIERLYVLCRNA